MMFYVILVAVWIISLLAWWFLSKTVRNADVGKIRSRLIEPGGKKKEKKQAKSVALIYADENAAGHVVMQLLQRLELRDRLHRLIEQAGLRIVAQKRIRMTRDQAETFYAVHKERPFFGELVDFMISGPVVVQVLEGEGAIAKYRDVMGATDPSKAADGTIRKLHAKSIGENSVHGSDAAETAKIEIAQVFKPDEIVG